METAQYDLIVIGAGPAGSACAITAARAGAKVLLLEKDHFPRQKVCGEFVSPESLGLLHRFLEDGRFQSCAKITSSRIFLDGKVLVLPVSPAAQSIPRFDLDPALFAAAAKERKNLRALREKYHLDESSTGVVNREDIEDVVSRWTGVPITSIKEEETQKLLRIEEELHKRIISQDKSISALARAIRRSRAGLKNPNRPIGSFLFLGPTGVGKTEVARTLAQFMFGTEKALVRFDMSEFMEKHSVSKLIGSPPGYVGYEEGGQLTERVKRAPYSVVLLDEIEKAHPDVFNILLQVFEDGQLTDGLGNTVDFKNTIIIMTSNIGARHLQKREGLGFALDEGKR